MHKLDSKMENKFYVNLPQPIIKNIQRNSICTFNSKVKKQECGYAQKYIYLYIYKNVYFCICNELLVVTFSKLKLN